MRLQHHRRHRLAALDRMPRLEGGVGGGRQDDWHDEEERASVFEGAGGDPAPAAEGGRGEAGDGGNAQPPRVAYGEVLVDGRLETEENVSGRGFGCLRKVVRKSMMVIPTTA